MWARAGRMTSPGAGALARTCANGGRYQQTLGRCSPFSARGLRASGGPRKGALPLAAKATPAKEATFRANPLVLGAVGAAGGFMGSLLGVGGGAIMIPLMTGVARLSQHSAHATSLAAVAATSFGSAVSYARHGQIDLSAAVPLTVGALGLVTVGTKLAARLDAKRLKRLLGLFMMGMAPLVPLRDVLLSQAGSSGGAMDESAGWARPVSLLAVGCVTGLSAGLFGVGGGAIMTPALALMTTLPQQMVLGTSLAAMLLPSMAGALQYYRLGLLTVATGAPVMVGTLLGSFMGGEVAQDLPEDLLRASFGVFLGGIGLRTFLRA